MRRWVNPSQPDLLQIATWLGYFRGAFTLLFGLDDQFIAFPLSDPARSGPSNPLLRIGLSALLIGGAYLLSQSRRLGWQLLIVGAALPLLARLLVAFGISFSSVDIAATNPFEYDAIGLIFEVALLALLVHPRSREYQKVWLE